MTYHTELAIVGAGPAGLEAAIVAAEAGLTVTLIDSQPQLGGQYFRQPPQAQKLASPEAAALFERASAAATLRLLTGTLVWGAFPATDSTGWLLTLVGPAAPHRLHTKVLILATGAYDRPVAFPGWTLPGVLTAGAVQTLLKTQGVLAGRRFLLAGSGPLQLAVAAQLLEAGAEVAAVLEGTTVHPKQWLRLGLTAWNQQARLREGWGYWRALHRGGIPYRLGWAVVEACGQDEVERVVIAQLDEAWRPIAETRQTLAVDTVVLGYGFIPATQISRLLGCRQELHPDRGGYVPLRDSELQTTCPGVYAVGDGAGVGGVGLARLEGRLAGLAAARRLEGLDAAAFEPARAQLQPALAQERRFAALLGELFTPKPGLYSLATEQTLLCRCEEVCLAEIRRAVEDGARTVGEVKGATRAGMGNCQGRMCGDLVARAIVNSLDQPGSYLEQLEAAGSFSVRPPLEPLPLSVLAEAADVV